MSSLIESKSKGLADTQGPKKLKMPFKELVQNTF